MFEMLFTVTFFTGFIILLRFLFKKHIDAGLRYGLWLLVAAKLLVFPMPEIEGDFSVLGLVMGGENRVLSAKVISEEMLNAEGGTAAYGYLWGTDDQTGGKIGAGGTDSGAAPEYAGAGETGSAKWEQWLQIAGLHLRQYIDNVWRAPVWILLVWAAGSVICAILMTAYHLRLRSRLCGKRERLEMRQAGPGTKGETAEGSPAGKSTGGRGTQLPVYSVEGLPTPCLFGRSIYVPEKLAEDEKLLPYVVRHEMCHYFHGDTFWGVVRMACVCLHWYHPFVWLAAYLSRQDCELACDEAAVRHMGEKDRKRYGELLLELAPVKGSPVDCFSMTTAMSGDAKNLRERLCRITEKNSGKKKNRTIPGICVAALGVAAVCACVTSGFVSPDRQWQSIRIREQEDSISVLQESYAVKYRLSRDAASYGLYMERYEYGEFVSAEVLDCAALRRTDGRERKVKKGEALFSRALESDEVTGAYVKSVCSYSVPDYSGEEEESRNFTYAGSVFKAFTLDLPEIACIGNSFSMSSAGQLEHRFHMNEDIVLLADYYGDERGLSVPGRHYFSAQEYGEEAGEILRHDRCVILTHLIISDKSAEELRKQIDEIVRKKAEGDTVLSENSAAARGMEPKQKKSDDNYGGLG